MTNKNKIHDENNYFVLNLFYIYETHFVFPLWKIPKFYFFYGVEIFWKCTVYAEFWANLYAFPQHFHIRKLGETTLSFAQCAFNSRSSCVPQGSVQITKKY